MKRTIIIVISVLVVVILGIFLFLRYSVTPPGTLPDPEDLPQAQNALMGQTVTVSFAEWVNEINGDVPFVYIFNPDTGTGRLAISQLPNLFWPSSVLIPGENELLKVSLFTVYTPEWKDLEGLLDAFSGNFSAKMEACTFISYQEGMYLLNSYAPPSSGQIPLNSAEIIDPLTDSIPHGQQSGLKIYTGIVTNNPTSSQSGWTDLGNGLYAYVAGNLSDTPSQALSDRISVFTNIVERFGLQAVMGMS